MMVIFWPWSAKASYLATLNTLTDFVGDYQCDPSKAGLLNRGPRPPLGATERFSRGHEKRLLLNSSAVILQDPSGKILILRQMKV